MADSGVTALQAHISALELQVAQLERERAELRLMLEMTTEHSDSITEALHVEIQQRELVQSALQESHAQLGKRSAQLEAITRVGKQVTGILDPATLLSEINRSIRESFGYYFVGIWVLDEVHHRLQLQASTLGEDVQGTLLALGAFQSIILTAFQEGRVYLAGDVKADPNYLACVALPETRSELALPLQFGPHRIGVLDIQSAQVDAFPADDISALCILADQIAIAIRNAQLYDRVLRFNEQLELTVQDRTQELNKAYQTLARIDRNKSDFIDIAAHELRTPLTLISALC